MKKYLFFICFSFCFAKKNAQTGLWGMTQYGGVNNFGVLFNYDPFTNIVTKKMGLDLVTGAGPQGSLMVANDGKMYGMMNFGGTIGPGTIFQYDPILNFYSVKKNFDGNLEGGLPTGDLVQALNGKIYGMVEGGVHNKGELFEFDPITGNFVIKIDFNEPITGANPKASLMKASNGKLYGTTYNGFAGYGTLFSYEPSTNNFYTEHYFSAFTGAHPSGNFIEDTNGMLYSMTMHSLGSVIVLGGTIFQFDTLTHTHTLKFDFSSNVSQNGHSPSGSLIRASDGVFYGMTEFGGVNDYGVIFKYNPVSEVFTKLYDFDLINGSNPKGSLLQASDGKLYGLTSFGGTNNLGVIFQYDFISNTYTKKFDFDSINGSNPVNSLVEYNPSVIVKENSRPNEFNLYPNPNNGSFVIDVNALVDISITNTLGEIILTKQINIGKQNVDIHNQINGIYFLKVTYPDGKFSTKKIIKK